MLARSLAFLVGVYFGIRILAALYRWLDLRRTIRRDWPDALRASATWMGLALLAAVVLSAHHRVALVAGVVAYVAFYVVTSLLLAYATNRMMTGKRG